MPSREEELAYLARLIGEEEARVERYSALRGFEKKLSVGTGSRRRSAETADIVLLRLRREPAAQAEVRDYEDVLTTAAQVQRAALLAEPGSGKSTTLRKLAVELARATQTDTAAPLPVLVYLGHWRGDESLPEFVAAHVPEIGWAMEPLNEVPTAERAAKRRKWSGRWRAWGAESKVIVSCRLKDYTGELDLGCDTLTLEPLMPQQVRKALRHWMTEEPDGGGKAERLFWQLAGDERLAATLEARGSRREGARNLTGRARGATLLLGSSPVRWVGTFMGYGAVTFRIREVR